MSTSQTIRLGLIQHTCPPGDGPQANVDRAEQLIRQAAADGATLIVTQELFTSHYFAQTESDAHFALAETIPGPTSQRLSALASELRVSISASLFEQRAAGVYHNTTILINPTGAVTGRYRKMHIPDDPGFYEKYYFTPGDATGTPWAAHAVGDARIGTLICWDQWFPEAARLCALNGAQVLLYPTAIGWLSSESSEVHAQQRDAWITVQRAHAITNGVFVAAINRVGVEADLTFWGTSMVIDPAGQIIAQADEASEQVLVVDCDLSKIDSQRQWWPFLRDRRLDAYDDLLKRMVD